VSIYIVVGIVIVVGITIGLILSTLPVASAADDAHDIELAEYEAAANARPLGNVANVEASHDWDYKRGGRPR